MAKKTLYIKDSDLPIWDLAQAEFGESISTLFADFLRERVKTMNAFVHVLRSAPSSQDLVVMFAPVGPTGGGGSGRTQYVREPELADFLELSGVKREVADRIAKDLRGTQSVSELTSIYKVSDDAMTVPQRVAAFLKAKAPAAFCDECIAAQLDLKRHQQAQQATSSLAASSEFTRVPGRCENCQKAVLVTTISSRGGKPCIDRYKLELIAPVQGQGEFRCVATNTDDGSTAEARLDLRQANALLSHFYGSEQRIVGEIMLRASMYGSVDLITWRTRDRLVVDSHDLLQFGFNRDELRPWSDERWK